MPAEIMIAEGWTALTDSATCRQPAECGPGGHPERSHGHHPAKHQARSISDSVGEAGHVSRPGAAAPQIGGRRVLIQVDLDQAGDHSPGRSRVRSKRADQPEPVNRVDHIGVPDDTAALVRLELPNEMPATSHPKRLGLRYLGRRFLVAVLTEVVDAKAGKQGDIGGGERLRDRDQRHLTRGTSGDRASRGDPRPNLRQVVRQLGLAVGIRHQASQTSPANRPVTPSRRYE